MRLFKSVRRALAGLATACLFGGLLVFSLGAPANANPTFTPLTLLHGWTTYGGSASPGFVNLGGIVTFQGAISGGLGKWAFTLPVGNRPSSIVYVAIDLCDSNVGRLEIMPSGITYVEEENNKFANAKCFTSLDGAWFAQSAETAPLTLLNGWSTYDGTPSVDTSTAGGIVRLAGSMFTKGTNAEAFVLPVGFRPNKAVYAAVDLCDSTNGRLEIGSNGVVDVKAENNDFANAACFTSLDGVSFAVTPSDFTGLHLQNGWKSGAFGSGLVGIENLGGIVALHGGMSTTGSSDLPFVIPSADRPANTVYVPVDLCNATAGRLEIEPSGTVFVQAQTANSNYTCFTSLDGVEFAQ